MMLFADPTELRTTSLLPIALQKQAKECVGLEERTGADLLVSPLSLPSAGSDALLRRHAEAGVLIQRKSGNDLPSSITDGRLTKSLHKMLEWSSRPWLAFVGELTKQYDRCFIDGRETLPYASVIGALDWWQVRGGYLTLLSDAQGFTKWVQGWEGKLKALGEHSEKVVLRVPQQALTVDKRAGMLLNLPNLGPEKAKAVLAAARKEGGGVAAALCLLTNRHGSGVKGIGKGITKSSRDWLGIEEGHQLSIVDEALLADVMEFLMSAEDFVNAATLYAALAEWTGVPFSGEGDWKSWAEEMRKEAK